MLSLEIAGKCRKALLVLGTECRRQLTSWDWREIKIDRRGMGSSGSSQYEVKEGSTEAARHIQSLIRYRGGPLTVAEWMKECNASYYQKRDAIGRGADFTTAPEMSQMVGELIGAWCAVVWEQMGMPRSINLVELGPGTGALIRDAVRAQVQVAPEFLSSCTIHLVEFSRAMRMRQREALQCPEPSSGGSQFPGSNVEASVSELAKGQRVMWHNGLESVPDGPAIVIAHEFFDALPVHQFNKTERGWCERLVDLGSSAEEELRFVLSPQPTVASRTLAQRRLASLEEGAKSGVRELEVSPRALSTVVDASKRIGRNGGALLALDYGTHASTRFSLRAIQGHEQAPLLQSAGEADLSADVDFGALSMAAFESKEQVRPFGPKTQGDFLRNLGIDARAQALASSVTTERERRKIIGQRDMLVGDDEGQMGSRYKAWGLVNSGQTAPIAFG